MINSNRDILVLPKGKDATEAELHELHNLLHSIASPEHFCKAHELVNRNRIISSQQKILKESRRYLLRSFRFLINKN